MNSNTEKTLETDLVFLFDINIYFNDVTAQCSITKMYSHSMFKFQTVRRLRERLISFSSEFYCVVACI